MTEQLLAALWQLAIIIAAHALLNPPPHQR